MTVVTPRGRRVLCDHTVNTAVNTAHPCSTGVGGSSMGGDMDAARICDVHMTQVRMTHAPYTKWCTMRHQLVHVRGVVCRSNTTRNVTPW